jgi:hypothetical protein
MDILIIEIAISEVPFGDINFISDEDMYIICNSTEIN